MYFEYLSAFHVIVMAVFQDFLPINGMSDNWLQSLNDSEEEADKTIPEVEHLALSEDMKPFSHGTYGNSIGCSSGVEPFDDEKALAMPMTTDDLNFAISDKLEQTLWNEVNPICIFKLWVS